MDAEKRKTRVGHREIARLAGVSQSTVSRALADSPLIAEATVIRVREAARSLGYRPDPTLAVVAAHRWRREERAVEPILALVEETRRLERTDIGEQVDPIRALKEKASELGYQMVVFYRDDYPNSGSLERVLRSRGIRGLVIGAVYRNPPDPELDWNKFVSVALTPGPYRPPIPSVMIDLFAGVLLGWEKIVASGHRRIGAALYEHDVAFLDDDIRASAVECCQRRRHPKLPVIPTFHFNHDTPHSEFGEWVRKNNLDAVLGFNSAVYWNLIREGFQIPNDLSYAELHVQPHNGPQSGVMAGGAQCAAEAVMMLHRALLANGYGPVFPGISHVVSPVWVEGSTLVSTHTVSKSPA
ncbi:MAG: LacI family transcriptional regulator [Puniceicoccaceae bacterium]|nr:MAG: LacI family transcriptional regulator [Puniceicoccaceae bacterium]